VIWTTGNLSYFCVPFFLAKKWGPCLFWLCSQATLYTWYNTYHTYREEEQEKYTTVYIISGAAGEKKTKETNKWNVQQTSVDLRWLDCSTECEKFYFLTCNCCFVDSGLSVVMRNQCPVSFHPCLVSKSKACSVRRYYIFKPWKLLRDRRKILFWNKS
jgi:hypothetical protein